MTTPFTSNEIKIAVKTLQNNKCEGSDGIKAELLKNCPEIIFKEIAEIFNNTARTGKIPNEIIHGFITALQNRVNRKDQYRTYDLSLFYR